MNLQLFFVNCLVISKLILQHFVDGLSDWLNLRVRKIDVYMAKFSNNWLKLRIFNSLNRFYYSKLFFQSSVLRNGGLAGCVVFLVAEKNVIEQGTVAWQE